MWGGDVKKLIVTQGGGKLKKVEKHWYTPSEK